MVSLPNVERVRPQLSDHLVKDSSVGGQSLAREAFDGVVEDQERSVLDEVVGRLDGLQEGGDQLRPLAGNVVSAIMAREKYKI